MYNRYVPNPDGSFARRRIPQAVPDKTTKKKPAEPEPPKHQPVSPAPAPNLTGQPVPSFLKALLPKDFDTGDLLVVLLLLLMAADHGEEKPDALLTLALYFFMQD